SLDTLANFMMDKHIEHPRFHLLSQWCIHFFLRFPAIGLMFAAANNSLMTSNFPVDPSTLVFFQFMQLLLAIGIITQALPPLFGAMIVGTFIYLLVAYDWKLIFIMLPVLAVGIIFLFSPWRFRMETISPPSLVQMRWVRILVGFG